MLSDTPWKFDAVLRLLSSIFLCVYAGSLAVAALHYSGSKPTGRFYVLFGAAMASLAGALFLLRKPWRPEIVLRRLGLLLFCFYAGLFLGGWAQKIAEPAGPSVGQMIVAALSFQGATLVFVRYFLREHCLTWTEAFGLAHQWRQAVLFGLILACIFLPVGWGLQRLSAKVMLHLPRLQLKPEEQQAVQTLEMAVSWTHRLALGTVTILLAPVAEEVLFRGILYPWIRRAGFPRLALWATAILFAGVHLNLATFLPLAVLAIALTLLYE